MNFKGGNMKPIVISWGFSSYSGEPYIDCYLEINDLKIAATEIKLIWRGRSQGTVLALLRVPNECKREDMEDYLELNKEKAIKLFKRAEFKAYEVTRRNYTNQAIDFIMN